MTLSPLLSVEALSIDLDAKTWLLRDVAFSVQAGETLAVVGESGCGKSLTSLAVMGLLPENLSGKVAGQIRFGTEDLMQAAPARLQSLRGREIAMVFQDALSALNPVLTVEQQIAEAITAHEAVKGKALRARVIDLLRMVRIPDPEARLMAYPHELSGGMRQRVVIAMAMACRPKLIIADEPTTALDVTVQAQILGLLKTLQQEQNLGLMLITHDLGVVRRVADRMAVMYAGSVVEAGPVAEVLAHPRHPYTAGLLQARPHGSFRAGGQMLSDIPGMVPSPSARPSGCQFAPRCAKADAACASALPALSGQARAWRCLHPMHDQIGGQP